uniref:HMG box domain-containing protein n=2 Tax=Kryptolebias marmoratus TaxID=37003 RepID=A0A3Q3A269_KRYMA
MSKEMSKKEENFKYCPSNGEPRRDLLGPGSPQLHNIDVDRFPQQVNRTRTGSNAGMNGTKSSWHQSRKSLTLESNVFPKPNNEGTGGPSVSPVISQSSAKPGRDGPICFTIPPTEEDLKQMQSIQEEDGYVKRPMNAFLVWGYIHRNVLQKAYPGQNINLSSVRLGCEWSKLSEEEKRPYYEVAHTLEKMHRQRF